MSSTLSHRALALSPSSHSLTLGPQLWLMCRRTKIQTQLKTAQGRLDKLEQAPSSAEQEGKLRDKIAKLSSLLPGLASPRSCCCVDAAHLVLLAVSAAEPGCAIMLCCAACGMPVCEASVCALAQRCAPFPGHPREHCFPEVLTGCSLLEHVAAPDGAAPE